MHIVIMGCGRVGSRLARRLDRQGHSIAIIDKNPEAFHLLGLDFKGKVVEGIGFDKEALIKAGIEKADAFIAVSSGDNSNFVSSRIAKDYFRVPKVVTRIYDPRRADIYRHVGVPTVAPVAWGTNKIFDLLFLQRTHSEYTFGSGEVELMQFEVPANLEGRLVRDFDVPGEIQVTAIERSGAPFIPVAGTALARNDVLSVAVARASMAKFEKLFFIA